MADITEIIEESAVQLEIVESGGGQIEIIGEDPTIVEVVETTFSSNDLDIATKTNTLAIETPSGNTVVNISSDTSTVIETTTTNNVIEITENQVLFQTGSVFNITNVTQSITGSPSFPFTGSAQISGSLVITGSLSVSETLFMEVGGTLESEIISSRQANFNSDGANNIITVNVSNTFPITVNSDGLIIFDEFTYTPEVIVGGFLFSGSDFYIGMNDF
tara:strand:+ start:483 stop:1136 length:654 start_codon:yes stop_codon:yes gene_type:complete